MAEGDLAEGWPVSGKSRQKQKGQGVTGPYGAVTFRSHQVSFPLGKRNQGCLENYTRARHLKLVVLVPRKWKERRLKGSVVHNDRTNGDPEAVHWWSLWSSSSQERTARWEKMGKVGDDEVSSLGVKGGRAFRTYQLQLESSSSCVIIMNVRIKVGTRGHIL